MSGGDVKRLVKGARQLLIMSRTSYDDIVCARIRSAWRNLVWWPLPVPVAIPRPVAVVVP